MEGYTNELLDRHIGQQIVIQRLIAPEFDKDLGKAIAEDPGTAGREPLRSGTAVVELAGYDQVGVTILGSQDPPLQRFVPWSAVISITPIHQ